MIRKPNSIIFFILFIQNHSQFIFNCLFIGKFKSSLFQALRQWGTRESKKHARRKKLAGRKRGKGKFPPVLVLSSRFLNSAGPTIGQFRRYRVVQYSKYSTISRCRPSSCLLVTLACFSSETLKMQAFLFFFSCVLAKKGSHGPRSFWRSPWKLGNRGVTKATNSIA